MTDEDPQQIPSDTLAFMFETSAIPRITAGEACLHVVAATT